MSTTLEQKLNTIANEKINKIIPENIKKGVSIFGVEGTLDSSGSGAIKQFSTVEEMQADTEATIGDLAVVYGAELTNWDLSSKISNFYFPKTLTLSGANTYGNIYCMGFGDSHIEIHGSSSETNINISIRADDYLDISYTSEDGINYTRTDTNPNTIAIGNIEAWDFMEQSDIWKEILFTSSKSFDGLYEYQNKEDNLCYCTFKNVGYNNSSFTYTKDEDICVDFRKYPYLDLLRIFNEIFPGRTSYGFTAAIISNNLVLYATQRPYDNVVSPIGFHYINGVMYAGARKISNDYFKNSTLYKIQINPDMTYSYTTKPLVADANVKNMFYSDEVLSSENNYATFSIWDYMAYTGGHITDENTEFYLYKADNTITTNSLYTSKIIRDYYYLAETQLTLDTPDMLLENVSAYGKNGVVTGNGRIWERYDKRKILKSIFGENNMVADPNYGSGNGDKIQYKDKNKLLFVNKTNANENPLLRYANIKPASQDMQYVIALDTITYVGERISPDGRYSFNKSTFVFTDHQTNNSVQITKKQRFEMIKFTSKYAIISQRCYDGSSDDNNYITVTRVKLSDLSVKTLTTSKRVNMTNLNYCFDINVSEELDKVVVVQIGKSSEAHYAYYTSLEQFNGFTTLLSASAMSSGSHSSFMMAIFTTKNKLILWDDAHYKVYVYDGATMNLETSKTLDYSWSRSFVSQPEYMTDDYELPLVCYQDDNYYYLGKHKYNSEFVETAVEDVYPYWLSTDGTLQLTNYDCICHWLDTNEGIVHNVASPYEAAYYTDIRNIANSKLCRIAYVYNTVQELEFVENIADANTILVCGACTATSFLNYYYTISYGYSNTISPTEYNTAVATTGY